MATILEQVRIEHHTEKYKTDGLVVRRGFPVLLETTASSLFINLVPAHPQNRTEYEYHFTLSPDETFEGWTLQSSQPNVVTLHIPPTAPIGMYAVKDGDQTIPMAVLFNAFCPEDQVYMDSEEERQEYVLNDVGRIWVGSNTSPSGLPWSFSQFRTTVMLASLSLLDSMPVEERNDPIKVTRHLSAVINAPDDNGVLVGRWDGNYHDGTSPSAWTGSAEILNQYWNTLSPVQYGQCWVFSGIFTTVMRALGLAARSVTNFVSAHDTTKPYNRAVDKYFDSEGDLLQDQSDDSIWNFHVWNEAFMSRPDLQTESEEHGLDYGGWQVLDATPQERSSHLYQLGPAPLLAIKHGFSVPNDVDFVIGEVNADVIHYWQVGDSAEFQVRKKYQQHVGQKISTKAVGADERNDITLDYKFPEGTEEERAALAGRPSAAITPEPQPSEDVEFAVDFSPDIQVGETIVFTIKATNNGEDQVKVVVKCLYRATNYTGVPKGRIGKSRDRLVIQPGETEEMVVEVSADQYESYLSSGVQTIQFNSSAKVRETDQVWSFESIVRINADEMLHIRSARSMEAGEPEPVTVSMTNISHMTLTNARLRAEGEGLLDLTVVDLDDMPPGVTVIKEITVDPSEVGDRLLIATLDSTELKDICRSVHVVVEDNSGQACQGQSLWQGQQAQDMAELVEVQSRDV